MVARKKRGRYDRQKTIWDQKILRKARVLVAGAGTLGNEICKNLALAGVGHITVMDFDVIEEVNLNRCLFFRKEDVGRKKSEVLAERLRDLNPEIEVACINCDVNTDIGAGLFLEFDVVIGGLDNIMARERINKYAYYAGTPYVDGAIEGLNGQVQIVMPPDTACYACAVPPEMQAMRNTHVSCSGTKLDSRGVSVPMVSTTASIIGALQVQEAMNIIHTGDSHLKGKQLRFDQAHSYRKNMLPKAESKTHYDLYENTVEKKKWCTGHRCFKEGIRRIPLSEESTLEELIEVLKKELNVEPEIQNDELICYSLHCSVCGWEKPVFRLKKAVGIDINRMKCPQCGEMTILDDSDDVLRSEFAHMRIFEFGIPRKQILMVNREIPIFLQGEEEFVQEGSQEANN